MVDLNAIEVALKNAEQEQMTGSEGVSPIPDKSALKKQCL
jgi:hypothetical protein